MKLSAAAVLVLSCGLTRRRRRLREVRRAPHRVDPRLPGHRSRRRRSCSRPRRRRSGRRSLRTAPRCRCCSTTASAHRATSPTRRTREYGVDAYDFAKQMTMIKHAGYQTIGLQTFVDFVRGRPVKLPPRPLLLTFDDARADSWTGSREHPAEASLHRRHVRRRRPRLGLRSGVPDLGRASGHGADRPLEQPAPRRAQRAHVHPVRLETRARPARTTRTRSRARTSRSGRIA